MPCLARKTTTTIGVTWEKSFILTHCFPRTTPSPAILVIGWIRVWEVDNAPGSTGAFGGVGDRNAPTVLNAGFQLAQFWDGRAADLQAQAKGPVLNPGEMAMPSEEAVLDRLRMDDTYRALFVKAFPEAETALTYDNMAEAIAAFERTLITKDRFDDFQRGDDEALSDLELKGLETFTGIGCTTCHTGPLLGGGMYQKVGLVNPYENFSDLGLEAVTKEEDDKYKFKVPTLRNVAITGPYFHDGGVSTLNFAVQNGLHAARAPALDRTD